MTREETQKIVESMRAVVTTKLCIVQYSAVGRRPMFVRQLYPPTMAVCGVTTTRDRALRMTETEAKELADRLIARGNRAWIESA